MYLPNMKFYLDPSVLFFFWQWFNKKFNIINISISDFISLG